MIQKKKSLFWEIIVIEFGGGKYNRLSLKLQYKINWNFIYLGKIFSEIQRLINDEPESWLNVISIWKNLLELDAKKEKLSERDANPIKRKMGKDDTILGKKLKTEQMQETQETRECQLEKQIEEETLEQGDFFTKREKFQELQNDIAEAVDTPNQNDLTFRVSCRCSGTIAKTLTAQVHSPPKWIPMFWKN